MTDLTEIFEYWVQTVDRGDVDEDDLANIDPAELSAQLQGVVSGQLMHLSDLGDPEQNEDTLREATVQATLKAFMAGLSVGREQANEATLYVPISSATMEAIGLQAIRDHEISFRLAPPSE